MSYVVVASELLTATAVDLSALGSSLNAANFAAAASTTAVAAAGMDEVSTAIASLFSGHAQVYQELGRQAAVFHAQFVDALTRAGASYASAEAVSATPLQLLEQQVLGLINAPAQAILGRPLIGNGADGAAPGEAGAPGGLLYGNGGNGAPGLNPGVAGGAGGAAGLIGNGGIGAAGGVGLLDQDRRSVGRRVLADAQPIPHPDLGRRRR
ncbi:hypothetical protein B1T45_19540 [Mycobacterium kansasii]|nr:hypothetical protein B1T45_19540 [Mycobacterium kansasii]